MVSGIWEDFYLGRNIYSLENVYGQHSRILFILSYFAILFIDFSLEQDGRTELLQNLICLVAKVEMITSIFS